MPFPCLHGPIVGRYWLPLLALIFGLTACKPARVNLPETTNSIGITMVALPAGSFMMGEPSETNNIGSRNDAFPQHSVKVPAFEIAKTEVTVGQYKKFLMAIGQDGLRELQDTNFLKYNSFGDDAPAVNLRYVREFIEWLNSRDGGGYRLPTEAEWEYACRAGGKETFCGGEDVDSLGWYGGNSGRKTHPVAQKKPNGFGLYDMSGNAAEWVEDCWHSSYNSAPTDGSAWSDARGDGLCESRVVRGGSAFDAYGGARATRREFKAAGFYYQDIGIRLARTH